MLVVGDDGELGRQRLVARFQPDFAEQLRLCGAGVLMAHQLQHGQEHADQRRLVNGVVEEGGERDAAVAAQPLVDPLHVHVDRRVVVANAFRARLSRAFP